ncbi:MAG: hypothetical protein EOP00_18100 [Pedobacter sp.]|nr:MAG: hypothetical protein EOP00_18100 [Pedobacter sp.]
MAAGGPGDHPLSDILAYNLDVYNNQCDKLVREISKFVSIQKLYEMFDWFDNFSATPNQLEMFEDSLRQRLKKLKIEANENGWEIL